MHYASHKFLSHYTLHNLPIAPDVSRAISSEPLKSENQTKEHGWLLVLRNTAKGVACETRLEPPPSPASLAVESTLRAKKNVFTHTSERQKRHLTVLAFLLYEQ